VILLNIGVDMKTTHKKALFLHQESREYRGLYRVRDFKKRAHRVERRAEKIKVKIGVE
jgi:hypothetical protein